MKRSVENLMIEAVIDASDQVWARLVPVLMQFKAVLDAGPDEGGWTARQVLSHIVGAWQRVPVHTAFFLTGQPEVPIVVGDSYWIPEWEHAPLEAFLFALQTAYEGNKAFIRQLCPSDLERTCRTPFGVMTLGEFLMTCYTFHIGDFHIPQLAAFLTSSQDTVDEPAA
ncbi:MAG TPA: DinB family protein [Ktedonobacteraceae bacterium]|nr:DinB family protein [Ktedonobacteraceae bacterium]